MACPAARGSRQSRASLAIVPAASACREAYLDAARRRDAALTVYQATGFTSSRCLEVVRAAPRMPEADGLPTGAGTVAGRACFLRARGRDGEGLLWTVKRPLNQLDTDCSGLKE